MKSSSLVEVCAEDEGRARDGPESEFGALLVVGVGGLARLIFAGMWAEVALGEHVRIGPVAGFDVRSPLGDAVEFVAESEGIFGWRFLREGPAVPVIVGDAPHLRVLCDFGGVGELGRAGRKAEHDRAAGFADGFGDLANFGGAVGVVADAVDLDVVEAPVGVELEHGVVVGLAGCVVGDAPVALVPWAGGLLIGCVGGVEAGAGDGEILRDYLAGNSAHDVDAELEALSVDPVGEGLESRIVGGGREAGGVGDEDSVFIPDIFASFECGAEGILACTSLRR